MLILPYIAQFLIACSISQCSKSNIEDCQGCSCKKLFSIRHRSFWGSRWPRLNFHCLSSPLLAGAPFSFYFAVAVAVAVAVAGSVAVAVAFAFAAAVLSSRWRADAAAVAVSVTFAFAVTVAVAGAATFRMLLSLNAAANVHRALKMTGIFVMGGGDKAASRRHQSTIEVSTWRSQGGSWEFRWRGRENCARLGQGTGKS